MPLLVYALAAACTAPADTWVRQQEIGTVPTASGMHLGASIAYDYALASSGYQLTRLYVGAPLQTDGVLAEAGVVYVFNPSPQGWVYYKTLTAKLPKAGAHFGAQVASAQGLILVSAPDYDAAGAPGAGYVEFFSDEGVGGVHLQQIVGSNSGGHFGRAVAVSGTMAAISYVDTGDAGCLQTLHYSPGTFPPWTSLPAAQPPICGASDGDALGASLAILQTSDTSFLVVAGAPGETHNSQAALEAPTCSCPIPTAPACSKSARSPRRIRHCSTCSAPASASTRTTSTSVRPDATTALAAPVRQRSSSQLFSPATILSPRSSRRLKRTTGNVAARRLRSIHSIRSSLSAAH
jgi:hypothetical protein